MDVAKAVTASFLPGLYRLTVSPMGIGGGTVSAVDGSGAPLPMSCRVTGGAANGCVLALPGGSKVTLTASADAGSVFSGWGIACTGAAPCTVTLSTDRVVAARFDPSLYTVSLSTTGSGRGTVTGSGVDGAGSPVAFRCAAGSSLGCTGAVARGSTVALVASPEGGSTFRGWSGGCRGTAVSCTLTASGPLTASAKFEPSNFPLSVSLAGAGQGTVTGPGIDCRTGSSGGCSADEANGATVTLTATPADAQSILKGWSGCSSTNGSTCTTYMTMARTVTATFEPASYPLALTFGGTGTGAVNGVAWTTCTVSACQASVPNGQTVSVTAAASSGSTFKGWGIVCAGTGTCTFKMNAAKTVMATFSSP
jgi:hypothetical protein